jgi:hypothetical protein
MSNHWHSVTCRRSGCGQVYIHTFHDRIIIDVDALVRRAMAGIGWYPVSTQDWFCPSCGARADRSVRDSAITRRMSYLLPIVQPRAA